MILQCNPKASYEKYKQEIDAAIAKVLDSGWYILGKEVETFEQEFSSWLGIDHAVGVANGTDAVELALRAAGVKPGDKVATVSHTAVATVSAIRRLGAVPMFVDIEAEYFTMDPDSLSEVIAREKNVKAVVVVHLYGQMANMPAIEQLAQNHGLVLIEDCAQAHGASLHGRKAGTWGHVGCFSFYPTKNLGCYGDGGAIVTRNAGVAERLYALRQYGWDHSRCSRVEGVNSRLDELQAAILRVRLQYLDQDNESRRRVGDQYRSGLNSISGIHLPAVRDGCHHVYHQFVLSCNNRDRILSAMRDAGVGCAIHYEHPVHLQGAYAGREFAPVSLKRTEDAVAGILSLPMYPELKHAELDRVVSALREVVSA